MNAKLIAGLVLACLALIFIFQNTVVVKIEFLFWSLSMSSSLLMVVLVLIGVVIGWLLKSYISFKGK
ncbi:MAG: DUF1049 domain-containing protein [Candidatus Omnitrophica bacterium]|nr:DUF1049 domain-containing protein [Candidatus Omnitrophota bacterium]